MDSAFPCSADDFHNGSSGMTLRDYFAAKAMAGYLASDDWRADMDHEATARHAYHMADAMMKAREA